MSEELFAENVSSQPDLDFRASNDSIISSGRTRVPGGAAAKLMLLGPKGSAEIEREFDEIRAMSSSESVKVNESAVNDSIAQVMQEAKHEFQKGSPQKRSALMSHLQQTDVQRRQKCDDMSETSSAIFSATPSFLNRDEIFHKTAAAAVAALLTPRASSIASASDLHSMCSSIGPGPATGHWPSSLNSGDTLRKEAPSTQHLHQLKLAGNNSLVTPKTEQVLVEMKSKMNDPNSTLTELLTAIASPQRSSTEILEMDLGNMVRRKNACGALQVLTTQPNNRTRICWTVGVLSALTSVLVDGLLVNGSEDPFPDRRIRGEYMTARLRAISALMNLSTPPRNRIAVFHTPDLVQTLVQIIENDKDGLARRECCGLLALLAKSSDNRLLMLQVPGLLEAVRKIIQPRPPRIEPIKDDHGKKRYPWSEDDDSGTDCSSQTSNSRGESHGKMRYSNSRARTKAGSSTSLSDNGDLSNIDGESGSTPKVRGSKTPRELSGYDETVDDVFCGTRQNLFALLVHLVKEKDNAYCVGHEIEFVDTLAAISKFKESSSHVFAIQIMANLTRHRLNKHLAFKPKGFVPALVEATQSQSFDARLYAIYALQNLAQEKSCRQELAISNNLILSLCDRCRNGEHENERLAAISTLKNLCDEPANLIPMTNTPGSVSTLMHFAHGGVNDATEKTVTEMMQYRACDALATLSHWLRKISTSGYALETPVRGGGRAVHVKGTLFVPSLRYVLSISLLH